MNNLLKKFLTRKHKITFPNKERYFIHSCSASTNFINCCKIKSNISFLISHSQDVHIAYNLYLKKSLYFLSRLHPLTKKYYMLKRSETIFFFKF